MDHYTRLKTAKKAIEELFKDDSVPQDTTIDSLRSLRDDIEIMIDSLEN